MNWLDTLISALGGSIIAAVGSIAYFRPRLAQARAESAKAETEAESQRADYLEQRILSMEKLYAQQGKMLDEMREKVLLLGQDLQKKAERINQLEQENKALTEKLDRMEGELAQYRMHKK